MKIKDFSSFSISLSKRQDNKCRVDDDPRTLAAGDSPASAVLGSPYACQTTKLASLPQRAGVGTHNRVGQLHHLRVTPGRRFAGEALDSDSATCPNLHVPLARGSAHSGGTGRPAPTRTAPPSTDRRKRKPSMAHPTNCPTPCHSRSNGSSGTSWPVTGTGPCPGYSYV